MASKAPEVGDIVSYWDVVDGPLKATVHEILSGEYNHICIVTWFDEKLSKNVVATASYSEEPRKGRWTHG